MSNNLVAIGGQCNQFYWFRKLDPISQWAFRRFGIYEEDINQDLEDIYKHIEK